MTALTPPLPDRLMLTLVFRDKTRDEYQSLLDAKNWSAASWSDVIAQRDDLQGENDSFAAMLEHVQERAFNAQDFELCAAIETLLIRRHLGEAFNSLAEACKHGFTTEAQCGFCDDERVAAALKDAQ